MYMCVCVCFSSLNFSGVRLPTGCVFMGVVSFLELEFF